MAEPIETKALLEEIDRYLSAVDLFRVLGCEPTWWPEPGPVLAPPPSMQAPELQPSDLRLH